MVARHFGQLLGGVGVCLGALIVAVGAFIHQEHREGSRLAPHPQSSPDLLRSTVIMTLGSTWLGRAYLDRPSQLLWTNYHVMRSYCRQTGAAIDCQLPRVWITQLGRAQSQSVRLELIACSVWIDACVFGVDGEAQPQLFYERFAGRWSAFSTLYALPLPMDAPPRNEKFLQGVALEQNPTLFFTSLPSRPGLSGSPVYDETGEFRGLMRVAMSSLGFNVHRLFARLGANSFLWFRHRTQVIGAPVLARVLLCHVQAPESCDAAAQQELYSYLDQVLIAGAGDQVFLLGRGSYIVELVKTLFSFADDQPAIVEQVLRAELRSDCPTDEHELRRLHIEALLRSTWDCRQDVERIPSERWQACPSRGDLREWIATAEVLEASSIWQASVKQHCRLRSGV